jgi:hypothetical protein
MKKGSLFGLVMMMLMLVAFTSCNTQKDTPPKGNEKSAKKGGADDHDHGPGPHGGTIIEFGKWHGEFVVNHKSQEATIYILDEDVKNAVPVKADTLLLSIKDPQFQVDLKAVPLDGEAKGMSSRFVGKHEKLGKEQPFAGTLSGEIDGKPYAGDFKEKPEAHDHKHGKVEGTPTSMTSAETREAKVFLTPDGIYTKADIEKNGNTIPSIKFKGIYWAHDDDLKVGDKVCPVTDNKADPQCFWWVNGEKYEFCCPPCLEKFVKSAKETPEKIKAPAAYLKKG